MANPSGTCGLPFGVGQPDDGSGEEVGIGAGQTVRGFSGQIDGVGSPGDTTFASLAPSLNTIVLAFQPGTAAQISLPPPAGPLSEPSTDLSAVPGGSSTCQASVPAHKDKAKLLAGDRLVSVTLTMDRATQTMTITYLFNGDIAQDNKRVDPEGGDTFWTDLTIKQNGAKSYDISDDMVRIDPSSSVAGIISFGSTPSPADNGAVTNTFSNHEVILTAKFAEVAALRPGFTWSLNDNIDVKFGSGQLDPDAVQTCGPVTF